MIKNKKIEMKNKSLILLKIFSLSIIIFLFAFPIYSIQKYLIKADISSNNINSLSKDILVDWQKMKSEIGQPFEPAHISRLCELNSINLRKLSEQIAKLPSHPRTKQELERLQETLKTVDASYAKVRELMVGNSSTSSSLDFLSEIPEHIKLSSDEFNYLSGVCRKLNSKLEMRNANAGSLAQFQEELNALKVANEVLENKCMLARNSKEPTEMQIEEIRLVSNNFRGIVSMSGEQCVSEAKDCGARRCNLLADYYVKYGKINEYRRTSSSVSEIAIDRYIGNDLSVIGSERKTFNFWLDKLRGLILAKEKLLGPDPREMLLTP